MKISGNYIKRSSQHTPESEDDDPGGRAGKGLPRFFRNIEHLSTVIPFPVCQKEELKKVSELYHMHIPEYYLSLIRDRKDPADPVRQQCVPSVEELSDPEEAAIDPLGEEKTSPVSCLVHRYPDRPHVEAIRIGTRAPVVYPKRVDNSLCKALGAYPQLWVNVQFNHPNEVTQEAAEACRNCSNRGFRSAINRFFLKELMMIRL